MFVFVFLLSGCVLCFLAHACCYMCFCRCVLFGCLLLLCCVCLCAFVVCLLLSVCVRCVLLHVFVTCVVVAVLCVVACCCYFGVTFVCLLYVYLMSAFVLGSLLHDF